VIPRPDYVAVARAEIARRAGERRPGWRVSHGLHGWTGVRERGERTERSGSPPGLEALMPVADRAGLPRYLGRNPA
jgi:hypothetical protein